MHDWILVFDFAMPLRPHFSCLWKNAGGPREHLSGNCTAAAAVILGLRVLAGMVGDFEV